jgi:gingipain R
MKKLYATLTGLLLISGLMAQNFSLQPSSMEDLRVSHSLDLAPFATTENVTIGDQEYRSFETSFDVVSMETGAPALPFFTESVILPEVGAVSLEITYSDYTELEGVYVAPSKGSLKRNINPSDVEYTFGEAYTTNSFYPGELATLSEPFIIRNTRGATIKINPYQYNPVTGVLRIYNNVQVAVKTNEDIVGENEIHARPENSGTFQTIYQQFYLNTDMAMGRYTPREEEGDLLVISPNSYMDEIQPFVDWKNQKGIKTTLVSKTDAGATDTEIKDYIADFYDANPDLVFVLLVGDHFQIPSHTYGTTGWEELWSDSYYGQMTGDYYPELFVGRFSGTASEVEIMVERTLEYEKEPAAGNWMNIGAGIASNEGAGYGDDGEADWQHARNNRSKLMDFGYAEVHEFYDGSQGGMDAPGNPDPTDILPVVNSGIGLLNYTGHGAEDVCVTGNFSSDDVNDATNNGKYPFVISVACNNGTFTSGTCISEVWLRATHGGNPTGAIAACGSTILMAWAEPMQTQDEMTEIIAESYDDNRKATLGGLFYNAQMSMYEDYGGSSTAREVMQTWVMFGDPSTLFRNMETQEMEVTHVDEVLMGITGVDVECNEEDALIAISQNNVLLGTAKVVDGIAAVEFDPIDSNEPLLVTGTKQNFKAYQGTIAVLNGYVGLDENNFNRVTMYPNPATDQVQLSWTNDTPEQLILTDLSGQIVLEMNQVVDQNMLVDISHLAPGVYILTSNFGATQDVAKLIVR